MSATFRAPCYEVRNIDQAKRIILTPEDSSTDQRWATETPYLGALMVEHLGLQARHRVLDYGTGIGRLAKQLIDVSGCAVIGVDTSVSMRALAPAYVLSDRFVSCAPLALDCVADVHFAIAVWALQHIADLDNAITSIQRQLRSFGKLFVVNMVKRCVPQSDGTWHDDGKDLREQLAARFKEVMHGSLDPERTTVATAQHSFWGVYQRRT